MQLQLREDSATRRRAETEPRSPQGYFTFLRGQRVTYFGRQGDQHTEWFSGASASRTGQ